jgi:hypothetical protein
LTGGIGKENRQKKKESTRSRGRRSTNGLIRRTSIARRADAAVSGHRLLVVAEDLTRQGVGRGT